MREERDLLVHVYEVILLLISDSNCEELVRRGLLIELANIVKGTPTDEVSSYLVLNGMFYRQLKFYLFLLNFSVIDSMAFSDECIKEFISAW